MVGKKHPRLAGSPFEDGLVVDVERSKRRINNVLKTEKTHFMQKLQKSKLIRTTIENRAAMAIQRIFRGHYVRLHNIEIVKKVHIYKLIRKDLLMYLQKEYNMNISFLNHKLLHAHYRFTAATKIQCTFRQYVSIKALIRRRFEYTLIQKQKACIYIQSFFRGINSRERVRYIRERQRFTRFSQSALLIQCAFRRMVAIQRVRRYVYIFIHIYIVITYKYSHICIHTYAHIYTHTPIYT